MDCELLAKAIYFQRGIPSCMTIIFDLSRFSPIAFFSLYLRVYQKLSVLLLRVLEDLIG